MADFNSSLPVVGSQAITNIVAVSGNLGVVFDAGDNLDVTVIAGSVQPYGQIGSVEVWQDTNTDMQVQATQEGTWDINNILTGSVRVVSQNVWEGVGSVLVKGTVITAPGIRNTTIANYTSGIAIAAGGSDVHYFTSTGSFNLDRVAAAFSGKGKIVIGESGPIITAFWTGFNSTANPNIDAVFEPSSVKFHNGSLVEVVRFNRETTSAQDVYSTIIGFNN